MKQFRFGLIGHPISHSLSPALFRAGYQGRYSYDLIEEEDFDKAYSRFLEEYDAINVTAPFKEQAWKKADISTDECDIIGAANILIKTPDGKIMAANSDHSGVTGAVAKGLIPGIKIHQTALIAGCGGAAKAAAYAMCTSGYRTVILNRNEQKAIDFAFRLKKDYGFDIEAHPIGEFRKWFRRSGVIIYTLPLAIPDLESLSRRDLTGGLFRSESKVIVEANYKDPAFTMEMTERMQKVNPELRYVDGKEWLLHQAVGAYMRFTDEAPNIEQMRKVL